MISDVTCMLTSPKEGYNQEDMHGLVRLLFERIIENPGFVPQNHKYSYAASQLDHVNKPFMLDNRVWNETLI